MNVMKKSEKRFHNIVNAISRFWFSSGSFFLAMVFAMIAIGTKKGTDEAIVAFILSGIFGISLQLFYERFFKGKNKIYWLLFGIGILFTMSYFFYLQKQGADNYSVVIRSVVLFFVFLMGSIWIPSIKQKIPAFSKNMVIFFKNFFIAFLSALILMLGIYAIIGAFDFLIHSVDSKVYSQVAVLCWFGFFPLYYLSLIPVFPGTFQEETKAYLEAIRIPKFFEILLAYIVIPILFVYTLILILYILQNITGDFWKDGLLEPLMISYVIVGWLTIYLVETIPLKIVQLFKKVFPVLLFIISFLQGISSLIKTRYFGLTDGRYFIFLFVLFSLISAVLFALIPKYKQLSPIFLLGLSLVSILPGINAVSIANFSQEHQLNHVLTQNEMVQNGEVQANDNLSKGEKEKIVASIQYLRKSDYLKEIDYLPSTLEQYDGFETVFGFNEYNFDQSQDYYRSPNSFTVQINTEKTETVEFSSAGVFIPLQIMEKQFYPDQSNQLTFEKEDKKYFLIWKEETNDSILLIIEDENKKELLNYDLTFLKELQEMTDEANVYPLSPKEATFETENETLKITLFISSLYVEEDRPIDGTFYLFIDFK